MWYIKFNNLPKCQTINCVYANVEYVCILHANYTAKTLFKPIKVTM